MRELKNVILEISTLCNFHCKHCCNDSGNLLNSSLTKEEIINLIKQLYQLKILRLGITGGEPFCDPNLFTYLEYAKDKIPIVSIASNGYLINEEVVERLKENNVNKIAISLDGMEDYHDNFRGKIGAYKKALEAINLLAKNDMEVKVRSVLTKENEESILNLMDITNYLDIKRHEIIPVCPLGRAETNKNLILTPTQYKEFLIKAINKIKSYKTPNITYQLKPVFYQEDLFKDVDERCREKSLTYTCDAFDSSLEIVSNGDIIGCSFVRIPVGNIRENKLKDIWNSEEVISLHNEIMHHNEKGECANCLNNDKCNGGCYANKLYGNGVDKKDVYCFEKRRKNV